MRICLPVPREADRAGETEILILLRGASGFGVMSTSVTIELD